MPPLTEERRKDLTKVVRNAGEDAKVAVRNLRRDANEHLKKLLRTRGNRRGRRAPQDDVQKLTDRVIAEIDKLIAAKEAEICCLMRGRTTVPGPNELTPPRHIAMVMDGNGRWARSAFCRASSATSKGGRAGRAVRPASTAGRVPTVFAFSSENWRRPQDEVSA